MTLDKTAILACTEKSVTTLEAGSLNETAKILDIPFRPYLGIALFCCARLTGVRSDSALDFTGTHRTLCNEASQSPIPRQDRPSALHQDNPCPPWDLGIRKAD
jgi:hypothetical protein